MFRLNKILKFIAVLVAVMSMITGVVFASYVYPRYTVPVLMYHRIDYRENDTLSVSPEIFAIQMKYLKENNYDVIPLSELVNVIKNRKKYSRKIVAITFDDGYANNFLYAFPILSKYNFPATIFLITNKVGESKEFVNWDQVRLMAKNGITFGAHTRNHAYLPDVRDPGKLRDEICGSKTDIERNIGCQVNFFCYPVGGFNGSVVKTVKEAGYEAAFTTNRGMDKFNKNLFELQRIKIMNKPFHFRIQLSGYYNLLREVKKGD